MTRIAAVILAAGHSSRFPGNKLLQLLEGKPVVRHVAEAAISSMASPVIVVTGNDAPAVAAALAGLPIQFVDNAAYSDGLSSSLRCGISPIPADCEGALVILGDMPFITAPLLDSLIKCFQPDSGREICVPVYRGERGNPVLWGKRFFPQILGLTGDKGAKSLIGLHSDFLFQLEVSDDSILIDIDTADDLGRRPA